MSRLVIALFTALWSLSALANGAASAELKLSSEKPTYKQYEPIVVRCEVRNNSDTGIEIPSVSIISGRVSLETADETRNYRPYSTGPQALRGRVRTLLKPGDTIGSDAPLLTNSLGKSAQTNPGTYEGTSPFPFARPGKYFIRATLYLDDDVQLQSKPLEVTVEPASDDLLKYFPSLEDYSAAVGTDYTVSDVRGAIERWEAFVRANSKSVYAPYVAYHIARLYLQGTGLDSANAVRAAELFTLSGESGPTSLKDDSLLGLAESQVEAGRLKEAKSTAERLLQEYPGSSSAEQAKRIRDGLAKGDSTLRKIYSH